MPVPTVSLPDGRIVHLGRKRPVARPQALRFARYLRAGATPPPDTVDWGAAATASLSRNYLNDQLGDCVIASAYHATGVWTGNDAGTAAVGTDAEVKSIYHGVCGPGDNGCNITDVLDYRKATGIPLNGKIHKIDGYVSIDWTNKLETMVAIYIFGCLTCGVNLPGGWESSDVWDVTTSRVVGGHDIPAIGYDKDKGVTIATWGGTRLVTWPAWQSKKWFEEVYAVLSPDWYGLDGIAPSHIDLATLQADLAALGGGNIPPIDPPAIDWTP